MNSEELKNVKRGQYLRIIRIGHIRKINKIDGAKIYFHKTDTVFDCSDCSDKFSDGKPLYQPGEWYRFYNIEGHEKLKSISGSFVKLISYQDDDNKILVRQNDTSKRFKTIRKTLFPIPPKGEVLHVVLNDILPKRIMIFDHIEEKENKLLIFTFDPVTKKMFPVIKVYGVAPMPIVKLKYSEDFMALLKVNLGIIEKIKINDLTFQVIGVTNDKEEKRIIN